VTVGLAAVVYAVVNAPEVGWLTWSTLGMLAAGIVLLVIFFVIQARSRNPLLRLEPAARAAAGCREHRHS
jgi:O-antigen ligase